MNYTSLGIFAGIVLLSVLAAGAFAYFHILRGHFADYAAAIGKQELLEDARSRWQRFKVRLLGWRTVILAAVAGLAQLIQPAVDELLPAIKDLPWVQVVDAKVATWITIVCTVLIPLTHLKGLAQAAQTQPQDQG